MIDTRNYPLPLSRYFLFLRMFPFVTSTNRDRKHKKQTKAWINFLCQSSQRKNNRKNMEIKTPKKRKVNA